jgi:predicted transposase YbfD/YdcC
MAPTPAVSVLDHFAALPDPRVARTRRHQLLDIVALAICAIVSGADSWAEVERYGQRKLAWLRTFLELPNGIPAHDTIGRVFARLDPAAFQRCFLNWVGALTEATHGKLMAIDGKTLRHSFDKAAGQGALHLVSAWATANHLVLGQQAVDGKSNEITAIPELLTILDLTGAIVTIDALARIYRVFQTFVHLPSRKV